MSWLPSLPKFPNVFGKKSSADIQAEIEALDRKCAADKTALETKLREAQAAEPAQSGIAPELQKGGRRRKYKGTRRHKKGKSKRARTGRKSNRL